MANILSFAGPRTAAVAAFIIPENCGEFLNKRKIYYEFPFWPPRQDKNGRKGTFSAAETGASPDKNRKMHKIKAYETGTMFIVLPHRFAIYYRA